MFRLWVNVFHLSDLVVDRWCQYGHALCKGSCMSSCTNLGIKSDQWVMSDRTVFVCWCLLFSLKWWKRKRYLNLIETSWSSYNFIGFALNLAVLFGFLLWNVTFIFLKNYPSHSIGIWKNSYQNNKQCFSCFGVISFIFLCVRNRDA